MKSSFAGLRFFDNEFVKYTISQQLFPKTSIVEGGGTRT